MKIHSRHGTFRKTSTYSVPTARTSRLSLRRMRPTSTPRIVHIGMPTTMTRSVLR